MLRESDSRTQLFIRKEGIGRRSRRVQRDRNARFPFSLDLIRDSTDERNTCVRRRRHRLTDRRASDKPIGRPTDE